ncbi:conserved hypothetical protein [Theileria equi strain WA]|uniref:Archease domain-containing protein n=1 Tax=Theileria equi strain WA TaxID=1537102 RepID=L1LA06_THEEQ|nr:conserved hypothetical protein [Theileria equi strain WA]EKX72050.1 conserved hypothetical protein [Theileria equi strain WA]|eukprot:XP_004831502.1 conserved hypothetical protein [Theileria equi strain WA]
MNENTKLNYSVDGINIVSNPPRKRGRNRGFNSTESLEYNLDTHDTNIPNIDIKIQEEHDKSPNKRVVTDKTDKAGTATHDFSHYVCKYDYLDHPADVILLGEGSNIREAFQSVAVALYNYTSDLKYVSPLHMKEIKVTGKGLLDLFYHLLDECLYLYSSDYFIAKYVIISSEIDIPKTASLEVFETYEYEIDVFLHGEYYDRNKHVCGTEVKAITMHYLELQLAVGDCILQYKHGMIDKEGVCKFLEDIKSSGSYKVDDCKAYALIDI